MMRLSGDFGRLEAHEIVYELAQKAISENLSFRDVLLADSRVGGRLTRSDLDEIMNPAHYTGLAEHFVDAVVGEED